MSLEQEASLTYLGMALWSDNNGLKGAGSFFYAQSDEERLHMIKILKYITSHNGEASLPKSDVPSIEFNSLKAAVENSLENEKKVTSSIQSITTLALQEEDYESFNFLKWFVDEQAEEEEKFKSILDKFEILGKDGRALYSIDKLMGRMIAD
ncbi:MAG: ferritin [Candidatus Marinimicrobia bacterium]|nr:ferritin [Candidatus Neomarinimicrobiota bacterium]|tara:strand:+ start:11916 stop:12371 length:456 start_codon:yes stop_codon:yes gene_type:complete